jgi:AcrR family transcriptional regulator
MPKPRGRNDTTYAATHQRLLQVARHLFETEGYEAVTTQAIAKACGLSQGSLFHHYASKRDLFIAVHNHWQDELVARIQQSAASARTPVTRFEKIWRAYLASTEDPAMRRVLLLDGPKVVGLEALRARDRETALGFFEAQIEELMGAGGIRRIDARALAILLFGALDQAAFEIADFPQDADLRRRLIDSFNALIEALKG